VIRAVLTGLVAGGLLASLADRLLLAQRPIRVSIEIVGPSGVVRFRDGRRVTS
jgi:hypothetical protein